MPRKAEKPIAFDLKAAREAVGLSQSDTARLLHASQASVSRWEIDGTLPPLCVDYWSLYWSVNKPAKRRAKAKANANAPA